MRLGKASSRRLPTMHRPDVTRFGGIPIEAVAEAIDRRLPPQEPISLAPSISENPLLSQRFSEGLYPRRISSKAVHQVTIATTPAGVALAGPAKLLGPPTTPKLAPREYQSFSRRPVRALVLLFPCWV